MSEVLSSLSVLQARCLGGCLLAADDEALAASRFQDLIDTLTDEHFSGAYYRCWILLSKYFPLIGGVPPLLSIQEMVGSMTTLSLPERTSLADRFVELFELNVSDLEFKISVLRLREAWRDKQLNDTLTKASEILISGVSGLQGYDDAVSYVRETFDDMSDDFGSSASAIVGGDINSTEEAVAALSRYKDAKSGVYSGVKTGFEELDAILGGLYGGNLALIAGFTSEGKSMTAMNIAYHACYEQGKNVLIAASEASRAQAHDLMVIRHSRHARFGGVNPLKYMAYKFGKLSADGETLLQRVTHDMQWTMDDEGNRRHGIMDIFHFPSRSSVAYLRDAVISRSRNHPIDLVVVDYLGLMSSGHRRQSRREELDDVLVQAKRFAVELDVPILSPWQISRTAWTDAQKSKRYNKASLSDTSQAEKASDVIMSILASGEASRLICQILKARDGESGAEFELFTDFSTCYVSSSNSLNSILGHL